MCGESAVEYGTPRIDRRPEAENQLKHKGYRNAARLTGVRGSEEAIGAVAEADGIRESTQRLGRQGRLTCILRPGGCRAVCDTRRAPR